MPKLWDISEGIDSLPPVKSRYLSRVPAIVQFTGSTGSGKSFLALQIIAGMRREGSLGKLYLCSPSAASNTLYRSVFRKGVDELFTKPDDAKEARDWLMHVEADVQAASEQWRLELECLATRRKRASGAQMSPHELALLEHFGNRSVKAERPKPCLLLDDCQGTAIMSQSSRNYLTALVLRTRHLGEGVGMSIFVVSQSARGVPRSIRLQVTALAAFATHNVKEVDVLFEEAGGFVSRDEFEHKLRLYTGMGRHSYMWVDLYERQLKQSV